MKKERVEMSDVEVATSVCSGWPWIVVSGVSRSGTSLMMNLIRIALGDEGEERIFGSRFPQEETGKKPKKGDDETEPEYQWRMYATTLYEQKSWEEILADRAKDFEHSKDMNPNGFWESVFVKRGVKRNRGTFKTMNEYAAKKKSTYVKVISSGLARSDPNLINKVVYMLRDPGSVAKSQERLIRRMDLINPETKERYNFWDLHDPVNSPEMFIELSIMGANWMNDFPEVPVHFVFYNDLISKPFETLDKLQEFLGEGDFHTAAKVINPKLKRSYPDLADHPMREDAELVYQYMIDRNWDGIEKFRGDRTTQTARKLRSWMCMRSRTIVNEIVCKECRTKSLKHYRGSAKATARASVPPIDWENTACAYEVAYRIDGKPLISIEESIKNNFWLDNESHLKLAVNEE